MKLFLFVCVCVCCACAWRASYYSNLQHHLPLCCSPPVSGGILSTRNQSGQEESLTSTVLPNITDCCALDGGHAICLRVSLSLSLQVSLLPPSPTRVWQQGWRRAKRGLTRRPTSHSSPPPSHWVIAPPIFRWIHPAMSGQIVCQGSAVRNSLSFWS